MVNKTEKKLRRALTKTKISDFKRMDRTQLIFSSKFGNKTVRRLATKEIRKRKK